MGAPEVWKRVDKDLQSKVTPHDYECYISGLRVVAEVEGEVLIATRTPWALARVGTEHKHLIQRVWRQHDAKQRRIRLSCWETVAPKYESIVGNPWRDEDALEDAAQAPALDIVEDEGLKTNTGLDRISPDRAHQSFMSLVEGPSNGSAARLLKFLAGGGNVPGKVLYISGKQGTGKTHLLTACQHAVLSSDSPRKVVYLTAEMFAAAFVDGAIARDTRALKARVRGADILLVDDLQSITKRPATEEEFLNSIRAAKTNGGTVVITADAGVNDVPSMSTRLRNELRGATTAEIGLPDEAMRQEIVRRHAELLKETTETFDFTEEMVKNLCLRVRGPGRELCGVLWTLFAEVSIVPKEPFAPTMEVLNSVIRRQLGEQKPPTLEMIKRATTRLFNVSKTDLESPTKVHAIVFPRQLAMYLCRDMTPKSYPQIGKAFGGRDHATVIYAVKKIERLIQSDPDVLDQVEALRGVVLDVQSGG